MTIGRDEIDRRRRALLVQALGMGVLAGGSGWSASAYATLFGRAPFKLPDGMSIFDMKGTVTVDGKPVTSATVLTGREVIESGPGGHLVAVVGKDAFILREHSRLEMNVGKAARSVFRLVTGAMLSVFGKRGADDGVTLQTPIATLGIRGTGAYLESDPDKSYVCLCYGTAQLASVADPSQNELAVSKHHDMPKYVLAKPDGGKVIVPAPFKDHTDLELMTLEALVGRKVPFAMPGNEYDAPRREDY
jgi:hypothetical protein